MLINITPLICPVGSCNRLRSGIKAIHELHELALSVEWSLIRRLAVFLHSVLLINPPVVFDPARGMTFAWVVMCPVNHAALRIPFILAVE